jgi:hypothetical protein
LLLLFQKVQLVQLDQVLPWDLGIQVPLVIHVIPLCPFLQANHQHLEHLFCLLLQGRLECLVLLLAPGAQGCLCYRPILCLPSLQALRGIQVVQGNPGGLEILEDLGARPPPSDPGGRAPHLFHALQANHGIPLDQMGQVDQLGLFLPFLQVFPGLPWIQASR